MTLDACLDAGLAKTVGDIQVATKMLFYLDPVSSGPFALMMRLKGGHWSDIIG